MYIWRGKNRRDRRNLKLSSEFVWGAPKNEPLKDDEDGYLREDHEQHHVEYFKHKIRILMHEYLNTSNGDIEVELLTRELQKYNALQDRSAETPEQYEIRRRKQIHEVFRKFDADGSDGIDKDELKLLVKDLRIPMTDQEVDDLMDELDGDGGGDIDFNEFYNWFENESVKQKQKNKLQYLWSSITEGFSGGLEKLILRVSARNSIMDYAVYRAEIDACKEYRIAHPPAYVCEVCTRSFATPKDFHVHNRDIEYHRQYLKEVKERDDMFNHVESIFTGTQGKKLLSNRLLFNIELIAMDERVKAADLKPFRPQKGDPGGKRQKQMLKGLFVQGSDPKAGVRPVPRQFGMMRQFRAPGRKENQPQLTDVLVEMLYCRDEKIDIVTCGDISTHADVRFQWNGFASKSLEIVGDFNGWKPEELQSDPKAGKCVAIKQLAPGKYRYRFKIDGVEVIDEERSISEDGPNGRSNIILVINPMSKDASDGTGPDAVLIGMKHINLRNVRLLDDGTNTFASFLGKNSVVEIIDLSYNTISDDGIQSLCAFLPNAQVLNTLKLNGNGFGLDGCRYLVHALQKSNSITSIELSQNRIGDDGAEILCGLIAKHSSIQELYLDSNYIGNDGCVCIGIALEHNRTLRVLTLASNKIYEFGIRRLFNFLRFNGTLEEIKLNNNPIGPTGAVIIGEYLQFTDSLKVLDISNIDLMRGKSVTGFHAIESGIRKNKSLKTLCLRSNGIEDKGSVGELGCAMEQNLNIIKLDLTGNKIEADWMIVGKFMATSTKVGVPSIASSLDRNLKMMDDPAKVIMYSVRPKKIAGEDYDGYWTNRRQWKKTNLKAEERRIQAIIEGEELERIEREEEYVSEECHRYSVSITWYLQSVDGMSYVKEVSKMVSQHIRDLSLIEPLELYVKKKKPIVKKMTKEEKMVIKNNEEVDVLFRSNTDDASLPPSVIVHVSDLDHMHLIDVDSDGNSLHTIGGDSIDTNHPADQFHSHHLPKEIESKEKDKNEETVKIKTIKGVKGGDFGYDGYGILTKQDIARSKGMICDVEPVIEIIKPPTPPKILTAAERRKKESYLKVDDKFVARNNVVISAIFLNLGCIKKNLLLHPTKLQQAFQNLCLPILNDDAQDLVDACITMKAGKRYGVGMILYRTFCSLILKKAPNLANANKFQRIRLVADLFFNPPLEEARTIIIDNLLFHFREHCLRTYRRMPGKTPKYLCHFCASRFSTEKQLVDHKAKNGGSLHHVKTLKQDVYNDQITILRDIKYNITGSKFPCYYEVLPYHELPDDFCPQVYDTLGAEGVPLGVIEPDIIVRVQDMLGDYFHISYEGKFGWLRWRLNGRLLVRKAGSTLKNFSWNGLTILNEYNYYIMKKHDALIKIELKVRKLPILEGEVIGYIYDNEVVEVGAVFGRWLQIRYNNLDAAWVIYKVGDLKRGEKQEDALVKLPPSLQKKFHAILKKSPHKTRPEELEVDEEEEKRFVENSKKKEASDWLVDEDDATI